MNERIQELAERAEWWKPLGLPSNWDEGDYVVSPEQLKKFAELIVRECIDIAEDTRYDGKVVANRIKFVFGVEE